MTVKDFLGKVTLDGNPISNVVQITADELQTTIVWDVPRNGAEAARRVITVESEAVEIG